MRIADHIRVHRTGYWHHGIFTGRGGVIHYSGTLWQKRKASICRGSLDEFSDGTEVEVVSYRKPLSPEVTIARAESCLGERDYSVVANNCEHFAAWCKAGRFESRQVDRYPFARPLADLKGIYVTMRRHHQLRQRIACRFVAAERTEREKTTRLIASLDAELRRYKLSLLEGVAALRADLNRSGQAVAQRDRDRSRVERDARFYLESLRPDTPDAAFILEKVNALLRVV